MQKMDMGEVTLIMNESWSMLGIRLMSWHLYRWPKFSLKAVAFSYMSVESG